MKGAPMKLLRWLGRKMRGHLLAGILVTVPIGLTVWILFWIFSTIDGFLRPYIEAIFNLRLPGVGFVATLLLVYLVGVIASNVLGRRLIHYGERLLGRIPVASYLYGGIRQIMESFARPDITGFMQVVLVEFPRKGARTIGFVTNVTADATGKSLFNVFIPTSPNPTSGFLQILEESEITPTGLSVDEALKMVVSGGRVSSGALGDSLLRKSGGRPPGTEPPAG
jgi:uncharacterized membrane protein